MVQNNDEQTSPRRNILKITGTGSNSSASGGPVIVDATLNIRIDGNDIINDMNLTRKIRKEAGTHTNRFIR